MPGIFELQLDPALLAFTRGNPTGSIEGQGNPAPTALANYSLAHGPNSTVSDYGAYGGFAWGNTVSVGGPYSFGMGHTNTTIAGSDYSFVFGRNNSISQEGGNYSDYSVIFGGGNTVLGRNHFSFIHGQNNYIHGDNPIWKYNTIFGKNNIVHESGYNVVAGRGHYCQGDFNAIFGDDNSNGVPGEEGRFNLIAGHKHDVYGGENIVAGTQSTVTGNSTYLNAVFGQNHDVIESWENLVTGSSNYLGQYASGCTALGWSHSILDNVDSSFVSGNSCVVGPDQHYIFNHGRDNNLYSGAGGECNTAFGRLNRTDDIVVVASAGRTLTFTDAGANDTITASSGSFVTDGFKAGQQIVITGTTNNNLTVTIQTVATTIITLSSGALTNEGPLSSSATLRVKLLHKYNFLHGFQNVVGNGGSSYNALFGKTNTINGAAKYNLISGLSNTVSDDHSLVVGKNNVVTADAVSYPSLGYNVAIGYGNTITGDLVGAFQARWNLAWGYQNQPHGIGCMAWGWNNYAQNNYSWAIGGGNKVYPVAGDTWGSYSFAFGYVNTSYGSYNFTFGAKHSIAGASGNNHNIAFGYDNRTVNTSYTHTYNFLVGLNNDVGTTGASSFNLVVGNTNVISVGTSSAIIGSYCGTARSQQFILGSNRTGSVGAAQNSVITRYIQTTSAAQTTLITLDLEEDKAYSIRANIVVRNTTTNSECASYVLDQAIAYRDTAGAAVLIGSPVALTGSNTGGGSTAWSVDLAASGNDILLRVTGDGSDTLEWCGTLEFVEVAG